QLSLHRVQACEQGVNETILVFMGQAGEIETGRFWWHAQIMRDSSTVYNCLLRPVLRLNSYLSVLVVRETRGHAQLEAAMAATHGAAIVPSQRSIFWQTSVRDPNLSSISQAGLVNNLNDGMAWGLFPFVFASAGMTLIQIGTLAAIYPTVWGVCQLFTGALSDRIGRKGLIVAGMWVQAAGIAIIAFRSSFAWYATGAILLGIGTAMVYPTLLAAIGDVVNPAWRASTVGVYRFWRDLGYAIGALMAGVVADLYGVVSAIWLVAAVTFLSGVIVAVRMRH
ncbi:MFS transporter, partial [Massilia frigida]|uniref:MFS transporter n=1 Tax=Massilia frigida TaxID=2609281 RepID=UPI001E6479CD